VRDAVLLRAIFEQDEYHQVRAAIVKNLAARCELAGTHATRPRSLRPR
jgi:hypothetical protein